MNIRVLDILVHSAGILIGGSIETLSVADYDKLMNINTRSAFILTQLCTPHIVASRGNMVHVSSVTGLRPSVTPARNSDWDSSGSTTRGPRRAAAPGSS